MKKILKWGLIGFVALIVIGALAGSGGDSSTSESTSTETKKEQKVEEVVQEPEVLEVVMTEFVSEFDKNQLAAEEKYAGKWIQLTAYIDNISEDIMGSPFLSLKPTAAEHYFDTGVQCFFAEKSQLTSLENGQKVTVKGKVDTQVMNVLVKECGVIE